MQPEQEILNAIESLKKRKHFGEDEIAYLAISGGVENHIRDKIAYEIYRRSEGALLGLTEKQRIDLLVASRINDGGFKRRIDCLVELKSCLPSEAIKQQELVNRIKGDFFKVENTKLHSLSKRQIVDYIFPDDGIIALWLFVFPRIHDIEKEGRQFLHLIQPDYRPAYRYMAGDRKGCRSKEEWENFDNKFDECLKDIEKTIGYGKLASGTICEKVRLLGATVSLEYHLFKRTDRLQLPAAAGA